MSRDELRQPLTEKEYAILMALLDHDFVGSKELRQQAQHVFATAHPDEGEATVSLAVQEHSAPPAPVRSRVPVRATAHDRDGAHLDLLLHVVNGYLHELEFVRYEPGRMIEIPDPESLAVTLPA